MINESVKYHQDLEVLPARGFMQTNPPFACLIDMPIDAWLVRNCINTKISLSLSIAFPSFFSLLGTLVIYFYILSSSVYST